MDIKVRDQPAPPQLVEITMGVEELAGLLAVHNEAGGGDMDGLRGKIEKGLLSAVKELRPEWRDKVVAAVEYSASLAATDYRYDSVQMYFDEHR